MFIYALTIFSGAFLLFEVEPLMGKYILPWFGGSPGVWTTCLLFFQCALLLGYAYAHLGSRYLKPKVQAYAHWILLLIALYFLPITPSQAWKPTGAENPILRILELLTLNLGLPYILLSATGPLVQRWVSLAYPERSIYRLYALSNVGSLLALVSYPFLFEWLFSRNTQAYLWGKGLICFAICVWMCVYKLTKSATLKQETKRPKSEETETISLAHKIVWVCFPALASILLLATTNKLCQDLAVIPFLWVLPLAIYLLSFILAFDHAWWYNRVIYIALLMVSLATVVALTFLDEEAPIFMQVIGYSGALFVACMFCHAELYQRRPSANKLTSYYLLISCGGALGGFLVAVVAPLVFKSYLELQLGYWLVSLAVCYVVIEANDKRSSWSSALGSITGFLLAISLMTLADHNGFWITDLFHGYLSFIKVNALSVGIVVFVFLGCFIDFKTGWTKKWSPRLALYPLFLASFLGSLFWTQLKTAHVGLIDSSRNFFGVLSVFEYKSEETADVYRVLQHGRIIHGIQFVEKSKALRQTTYYAQGSGIGLAINSLPKDKPRTLGLVGMGTGTLASYGRKGDLVKIYEINPQVLQIAQKDFTYLSQSAAHVDVIMGDARLSMENELKQNMSPRFDLLALDAFNSDAIPVHLLTAEAFETYLKLLKPDGLIAVHISNRYFDLQPVVENLAKHFGLGCVMISDDNVPDWWIYETSWMIVGPKALLEHTPNLVARADQPETAKANALKLWTDDYTSLFKILK